MQINKLVFGGLILGCLTAAGAGGYLAIRQNSATPPAVSTPAVNAAAPVPVTASEGVLTIEPTPAAAVTPVPTPSPAVVPPPRPEPRVVPAAPRRPEPATPAPRREPARQAATSRGPVAEPPAPSAAPQAPDPLSGTMWEARPTVAPEVPERSAPAPEPEPVAPPQPEFIELVVPADAVIGLQLESTVTSERAKVEDPVEARVTRDLRVGGRVAIPAGSLVHGTVTEVERGGKLRERARLAVRFHTVVLGNGDKLTLRTDTVTREGASPGRESAAKIGGAAIGGAILGAILGGGKGAAIGAGVGAGSGTAAVVAGDRNVVTIPAGSTVSVRIQQPATVTIEKE